MQKTCTIQSSPNLNHILLFSSTLNKLSVFLFLFLLQKLLVSKIHTVLLSSSNLEKLLFLLFISILIVFSHSAPSKPLNMLSALISTVFSYLASNDLLNISAIINSK